MTKTCPLCDTELLSLSDVEGRDATLFRCDRCGQFVLSGSLVAEMTYLREKFENSGPKLSHVTRKASESGAPASLTSDLARAILNQPLPRPREQADLLLRWVAKNVPGPGEMIAVGYRKHGPVCGSSSWQGFKLVIDHLFDVGLLTGSISHTIGDASAHVTPSFSGWDYYETLRQGRTNYRKAFMAMKFGDTELDNILESVFKPAVAAAGFELFKLNDQPRAGLIDDHLRVQIQGSDFVVADLTHENLGAYWEAGYAEGLGKPVIYTCEAGKFESVKTHFDTNHHLTITWNPDNPKAAGEDLKATIRATLPHMARLND